MDIVAAALRYERCVCGVLLLSRSRWYPRRCIYTTSGGERTDPGNRRENTKTHGSGTIKHDDTRTRTHKSHTVALYKPVTGNGVPTRYPPGWTKWYTFTCLIARRQKKTRSRLIEKKKSNKYRRIKLKVGKKIVKFSNCIPVNGFITSTRVVHAQTAHTRWGERVDRTQRGRNSTGQTNDERASTSERQRLVACAESPPPSPPPPPPRYRGGRSFFARYRNAIWRTQTRIFPPFSRTPRHFSAYIFFSLHFFHDFPHDFSESLQRCCLLVFCFKILFKYAKIEIAEWKK